MTALEALALARAEWVAISLAEDGAHILNRSRGKAPAHALDALRAAKPEIVALLRWRVANLKAVITRGRKRLRQSARAEPTSTC
jgi:hypothetical protein